MELCYIWVSEYKGFINQGFNFSSKLSFEFSQMDNKLTTKKNEKYIKDFFGNNIVNITGVVGQNGAGKTNVLELIQYIVAGGNTIINKPFFAIFENENIYSIYNYRVVIKSANFVYDLINYTGVIPNVTSIFFSNTIDGRKYNFDKRIKNISSNDIVDRYSRVYKKSIIEQIKFINSNRKSLEGFLLPFHLLIYKKRIYPRERPYSRIKNNFFLPLLLKNSRHSI